MKERVRNIRGYALVIALLSVAAVVLFSWIIMVGTMSGIALRGLGQ